MKIMHWTHQVKNCYFKDLIKATDGIKMGQTIGEPPN